MKTGKAVALLALLVVVTAQACTAKVYLRWTQGGLPPAKVLGANEIVIPWNETAAALLGEAKKQGYQAYVEVGAAQIVDAVNAVVNANAAGVILRGEAAEHDALVEKAKEVRKAHAKLKVLVLDAHGKQPEMRGWIVFKKDGILQVSSPTSQPWLDTNLAALRFDRGFDAGAPLYSFAWDDSDPLVKELGPKAADYALAIAEAGAYHADLVLPVHEAQQMGLSSGNKEALARWEPVKRYLEFYGAKDGSGDAAAEARVCVLAEDFETSFEALNLMARHNIPFHVRQSSEAKAKDLKECDVVLAFAQPGKELTAALDEFATNGGVLVTVKLQGPFSWESAGKSTNNGPSTTYAVGKGRVIALKDAVIDPETFAQDVRRLMVKENVPVSLWNSLTTIVAAYPGTKTGETIVELVNYDEESSEVQVQVKGTFHSATYETPEKGRSEKLKTNEVNGFTQFVVPDLVVGARVRLE
ncbi:MAG TPA: hypothetical protein VMT75_01190 [Candidatus Saccharimonadales bacterium]|nr:hypothetical protein [Candidatus Saccharimonadales bacterium]